MDYNLRLAVLRFAVVVACLIIVLSVLMVETL